MFVYLARDNMEIKPYTKNAKKHPKKQVEQVANSIKEFGMNQPIVVDKQGVIIVGHGRYGALTSHLDGILKT
jgi:ParB-like chromosome segregation protein Spo0J